MNKAIEDAKNFINVLGNIYKNINKRNVNKNIHSIIYEIVKSSKYDTNYRFNAKIVKYFTEVFKNISSNSKIIYYKNYPNIIVGKYGIGIRQMGNTKAIPLNNYRRITSGITIYKDNIIKGLKIYKYDKKVEEFEKFSEILTQVIAKNLLSNHSIALKKPIKLISTSNITNTRNNNIIKEIKFINIYVSIFNEITIYGLENQDDQSDTGLKITDNNNTFSIINNILLEDQIEYIKEQYQTIIKKERKFQKTIYDELDKYFGKYVMLSNLHK